MTDDICGYEGTTTGEPCRHPADSCPVPSHSDNDPDNLRDVHRRCHMEHHENDRAVDSRSTERFGPRSAHTGPRRPSAGDHPMP